jgi:hypothetical protein
MIINTEILSEVKVFNSQERTMNILDIQKKYLRTVSPAPSSTSPLHIQTILFYYIYLQGLSAPVHPYVLE